MGNVFFEIGIMIMAATLTAYAVRLLKQPRILAYILAGVVIGPAVAGLIQNSETTSMLSEIGIAFLLFIVGLEIDFKRLRDTGLTALVVGVGQVLLTFAMGFAAAILLGFGNIEAFYIGLILAFSSTMIAI
ncbi:cation:proton antiporter, partial [Candidatus Woesearchaeota archaeon]|nr:cation:proton antiporter [Candidatus Woesearchaeota archaeon]